MTKPAKLARTDRRICESNGSPDCFANHNIVAINRLQRRAFVAVLIGVTVGGAVSTGCNVLNPWKDKEEPNAKLDKLLKAPDMPDLVRQAAVPHGLTFVSVEGVAAVNRLQGTGGSVPPSGLRDELIEEMKKHEVPDPSLFLELPETALVRVQAIIPPGVRRGETYFTSGGLRL